MTTSTTIPGYTYGTEAVAKSPLTDEDFDRLKQATLFTEEDVKALRMASEVLDDQVEDLLDVWYGFVASHPFLVHEWSGPDGNPDPDYLAAVRRRFGQWVRDTTKADYDRAWLDYQHEIGLRHTPAKKNRTNGVQSASDQVPLRYLIAFIAPITETVRPFLAKKGHVPEQVEAMHRAWTKAVILQVALWSLAYTEGGDA